MRWCASEKKDEEMFLVRGRDTEMIVGMLGGLAYLGTKTKEEEGGSVGKERQVRAVV